MVKSKSSARMLVRRAYTANGEIQARTDGMPNSKKGKWGKRRKNQHNNYSSTDKIMIPYAVKRSSE